VRAWGAALALLAAVVAGGVLLLTAGGSSSSTPVSLAAYTSTQQLGFRFKLTIAASASGFNFSINGSGALNVRPSASGSMKLSVLGQTFDEVFSGPYVYVQTAPSSWYRTPLPASAQASTEQNPTAELDYLRAAGSVTDLGPAALDGVVTTHYHALVDLGQLASIEGDQQSPQQIATLEQELGGATTLPIDVWIDGSHLVRRLSLHLPIKQDGVTVNASLILDFLSYGAQPAPTPPPASEVTNTPPPSGL